MRQRLPTGGAVLRWSLFALLLAGLPLLGIIATGRDPAPYLEMPPTTRYVEHTGFSWPWFCFFGIADLLMIGGLLWAIHCGRQYKREATERPDLPRALKMATNPRHLCHTVTQRELHDRYGK